MRVYSHIYIYNTQDRCEGTVIYTYIRHRIGVRVYSHIYIYNTQDRCEGVQSYIHI